MKQLIAMLGLMILIVMSSTNGFSQTNKKTDKARKNVKKAQHNLADAKQDLHQARLDSTEDFIQFKKEAQEKIAANDREIELLSEKKWDNKSEYQKMYDQEIFDLKKRNRVLQQKIDVSQATMPSKWSAFKKEFSHDMSELGKAIKNTTVNSKK